MSGNTLKVTGLRIQGESSSRGEGGICPELSGLESWTSEVQSFPAFAQTRSAGIYTAVFPPDFPHLTSRGFSVLVIRAKVTGASSLEEGGITHPARSTAFAWCSLLAADGAN